MISGQWFQRKRSKNCQKFHMIAHSMPIIPLKIGIAPRFFNKSGRGQPKKHPHQICNKSLHQFKRGSKMG